MQQRSKQENTHTSSLEYIFNKNEKILEQLNKHIKRINLIYKNPEIILFCDLNPDLDFTPELIENTIKLKLSE